MVSRWTWSRTNRRHAQALDDALKSLANLRHAAEEVGLPDIIDLINLQRFFYLWRFDYFVIASEFFTANHPRVQGVYARILSMQLYEHFSDMATLLGRRFREIIGMLPDADSLLTQLNKLHSEHTRLKREHQEPLKHVRNIAVAHRDHDAAQQLATIEQLDPLEVAKLNQRIHEWSLSLDALLLAVTRSVKTKIEESALSKPMQPTACGGR